RRTRVCGVGVPRSCRWWRTRRSTISTGRRCGSRHRTFRCRPPTSWKTSRCPPSTASSIACAARCRHSDDGRACAEILPRTRCAPSPRLWGEGRGEGDSPRTLYAESPPPPPPSLAPPPPPRGGGKTPWAAVFPPPPPPPQLRPTTTTHHTTTTP